MKKVPMNLRRLEALLGELQCCAGVGTNQMDEIDDAIKYCRTQERRRVKRKKDFDLRKAEERLLLR